MLGKYFNDPQLKDQEFDRLRQQGWHRLQEDLKEVVGKGKVGRGRDIELVIGTLEFISHIPDKNIVNHSVCRIEKGELKELWKSLQKFESGTGIKSVGEKTASLFLRDLVTLLDLEPKISEGWECLQPIDTWVRKVCEKVGIEEKRNLRKSIVDVCNSQGVSPVKFNMGAWYVGYHALDVLLDLLRASQQSRGTHGQIKYTKSSTNTENG